jgi:hypothetical protein
MSDEVQPDAANDTAIDAANDTETTESHSPDVDAPDVAESAAEGESDTFDRAYVEKLRKESAGYRDKAKTAEASADSVSRRLHAALVAATGRLADPADLPYSADHLDDAGALTAAIDSLLEAKPHFASRVPRGDVGQGVKDSAPAQVDLLGRIRGMV